MITINFLVIKKKNTDNSPELILKIVLELGEVSLEKFYDNNPKCEFDQMEISYIIYNILRGLQDLLN